MSRAGLLLTLGAIGLGAPACSSFERDWEGAAAVAPASDLEGRWQGTWLSAVNGHSGGLRCLVTRRESGAYDARYHATYGCCFSFEYTVELTAAPHGAGYILRGSADLGWLAGGVYSYETTVEGGKLRSTYTSEADHGTYEMTRLGAVK
jgi:hypothetical protein